MVLGGAQGTQTSLVGRCTSEPGYLKPFQIAAMVNAT